MNYFTIPGLKTDGLSAQEIVSRVARVSGIDECRIYGTGRTAELVAARNVAIFLIKIKLGLTLKSIGRLFDKDHTTVIHALKYVKESAETGYYPVVELLRRLDERVA